MPRYVPEVFLLFDDLLTDLKYVNLRGCTTKLFYRNFVLHYVQPVVSIPFNKNHLSKESFSDLLTFPYGLDNELFVEIFLHVIVADYGKNKNGFRNKSTISPIHCRD